MKDDLTHPGERIARYLALASLPTLGVTGIAANADFVNYGGPVVSTDAITPLWENLLSSVGSTTTYAIATTSDGIQLAGVHIETLNTSSSIVNRFARVAGGLAIGSMGELAIKSISNSSVQGFAYGEAITASNDWGNSNARLANTWRSSATVSGSVLSSDGGYSGDWADGAGPVYAGFRLDSGDGDGWMYGWILLEWDGTVLTMYDWAYDTSGKPVTAGQTAPVPGLGGLALLAAGATGLRRKRKQHAG